MNQWYRLVYGWSFVSDISSTLIETEVELEEEAEQEKRAVNRSLQINTVQNDAEQKTSFALPATPLQICGYDRLNSSDWLFAMLLQSFNITFSLVSSSIQPFSSKSKKPPRSSLLSIGGSSGIYGTPRFGKLNPLQPLAKIHNDKKDEMPEILQGNASPNSGVKSGSPNSKRVSPPQSIGLSPGQRSSRKLILQSIPSFPSLTPKHWENQFFPWTWMEFCSVKTSFVVISNSFYLPQFKMLILLLGVCNSSLPTWL